LPANKPRHRAGNGGRGDDEPRDPCERFADVVRGFALDERDLRMLMQMPAPGYHLPGKLPRFFEQRGDLDFGRETSHLMQLENR
jgi:hypothetical protein